MKIDPTFLRQVQTAGWQIAGATEDKVLAGCPTPGCPVKVTFAPGQQVRQACGQGQTSSVVVGSFDDARLFLRARRNALALAIRDVEDVAGISVDFLAKFEKDDPSKYPNAQTFLEWVQALGYEVVLRPAVLPLYALRVIAETRPRTGARTKAQDRVASLRASAAQVTKELP